MVTTPALVARLNDTTPSSTEVSEVDVREALVATGLAVELSTPDAVLVNTSASYAVAWPVVRDTP
jgi:hypothetical protein